MDLIYLTKSVLFVSLILLVKPSTSIDVIEFQEDNIPSIKSKLTYFFNDTTNFIENFTVCVWVRISYFRRTSYAFSYATSQERNNELNLFIKPDGVNIVIASKYIYGARRNIIPNIWYHICVSSTETTHKIYINGELQKTVKKNRRPQISMKGSLVLGQETDNFNGGFQKQQSFSGKITDLNIYEGILKNPDIYTLSSCFEINEKNKKIFDWNNVIWDEISSVNIKNISLREEICGQRKSTLIVPIRKNYQSSVSFCTKIGGELLLPQSIEENMALYDTVKNITKECKPLNHATGFFRLGGQKSDDGWTDSMGRQLNYSNARDDLWKGIIYNTLEKYSWSTANHRYEFCFGCDMIEPILTLRGLCHDDDHNSLFIMDQTSLTSKPYIRGFTSYNITYSNNSWYLFDMWSDTAIASLFSFNLEEEQDYPIGLKHWKTLTDFNICNLPKDTKVDLMLSRCKTDEFTCNDGTCIKMNNRCNLVLDCPDNSDESNCKTLRPLEKYMRSLPPPESRGQPSVLNASVHILGVSEVDIQNLKITIDFSLTISWYDTRITFANLDQNTDLNAVITSKLWTPEVEFVNADFADMSTQDPVLFAVKKTEPEQDDLSRAIHDEVYLGRKNPLRLLQKINAPFYCNMDLTNFPFDSQKCFVKIKLKSSGIDNAVFHTLESENHGGTMLTEYVIGEIQNKISVFDGYSLAIIEIPLQRRFGYYMTTAYIPILMMLLISYSSLFLRYDSADLRVMLTITTLLVLYSLYQQVSDGLPKTSYVKSIDIWCFFAISYIFSIVIYHVAMSQSLEEAAVVSKMKFGFLTSKEKKIIAAKLIYFSIFILFILFYFIDIYVKTRSDPSIA